MLPGRCVAAGNLSIMLSITLALLFAAPALADGPLGPEGSPLTTSNYTIDRFL